MITKPKIIYLDIETTLAQFWGFRLGEQRISWEQIKKEPQVCVICWAVNDGEIQSATFDMNKYDPTKYDDDADYKLIADFIKVASTADLLIAHNSPFDLGVLGSRLMKHQLPDLAPTLVDDTYFKTKVRKTMSHKLDYLLRYFNIGKKVEHRGLETWKDVGLKNKKALQELKEYCIGDVDGLRKLYKYITPYIKSNLNLAVFYGKPDICPRCSGEDTIQKRGFHRTLVGKYQRYQCTTCGWWGHDGTNQISKKRSGIPSSQFVR